MGQIKVQSHLLHDLVVVVLLGIIVVVNLISDQQGGLFSSSSLFRRRILLLRKHLGVHALSSSSSISSIPNNHNKFVILGLGRVGLECGRMARPFFHQVVGTVRPKNQNLSSLTTTTKKKGNEKEDDVNDDDNDDYYEDGIERISIYDTSLLQQHLLTASHVLWTIPLKSSDTNVENQHDSTSSSSPLSSPSSELVLDHLMSLLVRTSTATTITATNTGTLEGGIDDRNPTTPTATTTTTTSLPCRWMGFVSTTGVYGNHDGKNVTEASPLLYTPSTSSNANLYRCWEERWLSSFTSLDDGPTTTSATPPPSDENPKHDTPTIERMTTRMRRAKRKNTGPFIFRCAGIYDSSRSALHTVYKQQQEETSTTATRTRTVPPMTKTKTTTPRIVAGQPNNPIQSNTIVSSTKTNRIHSYDIARAIVASMRNADHFDSRTDDDDDDDEEGDNNNNIQMGERIYNLADNDPAPRSVVLEYATELLHSIGIIPPIREPSKNDVTTSSTKEKDLSSLSSPSSSTTTTTTTTMKSRDRRRLTDQKWVSNQKMKMELISELIYPTYREGLQAILMDPQTPWQQQQPQLRDNEEKK